MFLPNNSTNKDAQWYIYISEHGHHWFMVHRQQDIAWTNADLLRIETLVQTSVKF